MAAGDRCFEGKGINVRMVGELESSSDYSLSLRAKLSFSSFMGFLRILKIQRHFGQKKNSEIAKQLTVLHFKCYVRVAREFFTNLITSLGNSLIFIHLVQKFLSVGSAENIFMIVPIFYPTKAFAFRRKNMNLVLI